ncbi:uncharacterized protein LOC103524252 [Diaphorina citri]|uniref:Uncharacterized protein LOC103524252 n=1 Tax=Diaphorina citri TaxID=121845 RepID=A0A3Q0JL80_DIACI|nr:uncharacterized protein LOC103524252 [Diaphorina citri]
MHVLDTALITKRLEALLSVPPPSLPTPSSQHLDLMTPDAFTSSSQHNSPHSVTINLHCNSNDKGQDGPVDNTDWPDAPPVHKVKPEKKTPVIETQPKKRAYNGGPMFNEDSHIGGGVPDPALETIVLSLQKMAATIQTLSSQV